ncbi:MAG: lipid IV(A) 3-deoxy-D-manno-octulosonic acid transferase [Thiotrichaceae bacterium]|nr:lipid IV(A) 3-deoxy-D-manno-octulosonic acid transferase [Thiotrichaceae bacterium]
MRALYSILLYLLMPFVCLRLLWRGRRAPAYWQRWDERFAFTLPKIAPHGIWIHAVSVGEFQAAQPLIKALLTQYPELSILITTTTPTGSARVQASFAGQVSHVYLPYDLPIAMRRFVKAVQPRLLILMETELWVNLLHICQQHEIPVILANARLSARSAAGYQRVVKLIRPALQSLHCIAVQTTEEAARFQQLGVPAEILKVIGSIKFDLEVSPELQRQGQLLRQQFGERIVWIAASTHAGEDEIILEAFQQIRVQVPNLLLILVPRHPERFNAVAIICKQSDSQFKRRSLSEIANLETAIYLGDTMGELMLLFAASDIAFIGGSLVPTGGHNLLEPAALGLPVIFGEHIFNFKEISQRLLSEQAAVKVHNMQELANQVLGYAQDAALRQATGARGQAFVEKNRGALQRLLKLISAAV